MRWPWNRDRPDMTTDVAPSDGAKAHREATAHLAETTAHWPEVKRVSQSLRELRERNHFRDQLELIFQGDTKP